MQSPTSKEINDLFDMLSDASHSRMEEFAGLGLVVAKARGVPADYSLGSVEFMPGADEGPSLQFSWVGARKRHSFRSISYTVPLEMVLDQNARQAPSLQGGVKSATGEADQ